MKRMTWRLRGWQLDAFFEALEKHMRKEDEKSSADSIHLRYIREERRKEMT